MSTTTTTPVTTAVREVLTDYDLHHSNTSESSGEAAPVSSAREETATSVSNPDSWPTDHRRVPPYRPINYNLDFAERPGGTDAAEYIFIAVMLNGVGVAATANSIWRATAGKVNDRIFRYQIGGEW